MDNTYQASTAENKIKFINFEDLAAQAKKIIPQGGWGYISGGSGDEWTMRANTEAFNKIEIYPRVLANIEKPDLKTKILGTEIASPIIMAPCAAHGLAHVTAEKGTAQGVAAAGTIMSVSTYSNDTINDIAEAGKGATQWFQLYLRKDDGFNEYIIQDAVANGYKAIILTVDATVGGNREADVRNNFAMPLPMANLEKLAAGKGLTIKQIFADAKQNIGIDDVKRVSQLAKLPVIVKGIQTPEDALLAIGAGAQAIWVSNHGGRQLDGAPASIDVLEDIARAVDKKVPIIFDSGIRRGQHVFKALAKGADVVALGRPCLYGLALGGSQGVTDVFEFFNKELAMVMQLAGAKNVEEAKRALLRQDTY